jgi:hypothetical protein
MAGTWEAVSSRRTTQVLSPTQVQDVMLIGIKTIPHGVYFERAIPYADWLQSPAGIAFYAEPPADNIEFLLGNGTAIAASYIEDLDAAGLVKGFIAFVIQVPSPSPDKPGPFQATVDVPIETVSIANISGGGLFSPEFNQALASLQQTAGL